MTRNEALKKAVRLFGKQGAVRDDGRPSGEADRRSAFAEAEMLRSIPEADRGPNWKKDLGNARTRSHYYRFTVGHVWSIGGFGAFSVEGQGDTWGDAFAKASKK